MTYCVEVIAMQAKLRSTYNEVDRNGLWTKLDDILTETMHAIRKGCKLIELIECMHDFHHELHPLTSHSCISVTDRVKFNGQNNSIATVRTPLRAHQI